jgi:HlyD family secretion protein
MKKKKIYWIVGIVVVIVIALVVYKKKSGSGNTSKVFTQEVITQDITETVSANGKIQPEVNVKISSEISGEIIELNVVEGQKVQKGDLLIKINPDIYISALNRVEASLNSSKADLANAKARSVQVNAKLKNSEKTYNRNKTLFEQGAISEAEFENREAEYEQTKAEADAQKESVNAARYRVKSAEATRKEALENLNRTTIYAPDNGTVSGLQVEKGERVVGTGQMAGTPMMDIAKMEVMEVNVEVNESDIVRVGMGDTALIEVDAYLNRKFKGVVTEIANASTNQSSQSMDQVTNFEVKIRILPESYVDVLKDNVSPFKPGMSATVEIQTKTVQLAIAVPIEAVTTREDTSSSAKSYDKYRKKGKDRKKRREKRKKDKSDEAVEDSDTDSVASAENDESKSKENKKEKPVKDQIFTLVFVLEGDKAVVRIVETGIQDDEFIEIKSGLEEGEEVITGPYDQVSRKLTNGTTVEVTGKEDFYSGQKD